MDDQITVIVRTKTFIVPKSILLKSELFQNLFNDAEVNGPIILNQSPNLFKYVLEVLYDNTYPYPSEYKQELNKYLIPLDYINSINFVVSSNELHDIIKNTKEELNSEINFLKTENAKLHNKIKKMKKQMLSDLCKCDDCDAATFYDYRRDSRECIHHRGCYVDGCETFCAFGCLFCHEHGGEKIH